MVEPPKSSTFTTSLHSSQGTTPSRDLVTHITGTTKDIPIGTLLEGKVLSQTSSGLTTLKTSHGDITFQTQIGLLKGSLVTLRVTSTGEDFQARLVSVNGQSLLEYLGGKTGDPAQTARVNTSFTLPQDEVISQQGGSSQQASSQAATAQGGKSIATPNDTVLQRNGLLSVTLLTGDKATIGQAINNLPQAVKEQLAVFLQSATPRNAPVAVTADNIQQLLTRAGNVLEFKIINYQLPSAPSAGSGAATNQGVGTGQASSSQASTNSAGVVPSNSPSTANSTAGATSISAQPNANVPSASGAAGGNVTASTQAGNINANNVNLQLVTVDPKTGHMRMAALVIGQETNGQSVIKTPLGIFHHQGNLPKGAIIELELANIVTLVSATSANTALNTQALGANDAIGKLLNFWKMFASSDTAKTLQDAGASRMDAFQSRFPNADKDLGANLLRFFSSVAKQDTNQLLGKILTDSLQRMAGGQEVLEQLARDLGANRQLQQQVQYDWKSFVFPVVSDDTWYANRLMLKEYEGKNADGEAEKGVRFVIEMEMEKLGPLQLDGLVRKTANGHYFDLTMRSELPIPKAARDGIFDIFVEAQEEFGVEGRLIFQLTPELPDPIKESAAESARKGEDGEGSIIV